jgi:SDR family mycofactocin-dependent oxidoreductase
MTAVGRVALVTGAARGIGAATVRALAVDGWHVLAVDRAADDPSLPYSLATEADLVAAVSEAAAAAEANGADGQIVATRADVRDVGALTTAVAEAESRWGGLDAAIACAGVIAGGAPQWKVPAEQERAVLDIDLGGVLRRPRPRSGRFLAVASAAATRGLPTIAAYCAAKAGVTGFIRALAVELGPTGVTANAVSPGSTATAMLDASARLYGLAGPEEFLGSQPIGRLLSPGEVAAVLAFLASPVSAGMTGAVVPVDGGMAL